MAKNPSKLDRKLNEFSRAAFLTPEGRPKSAAFLYGFLLSVLYGLIYIGIYILFGFLLGQLWPEGSLAAILLHYLATALVGSGICLAACLFLKGPRRCFPWYAYVCLAILLGLMILTSLVMCDWAGGEGWLDLWQYCTLVFFPALLSLIAGGIPARILWNRELAKKQAMEEKGKRPSYYYT